MCIIPTVRNERRGQESIAPDLEMLSGIICKASLILNDAVLVICIQNKIPDDPSQRHSLPPTPASSIPGNGISDEAHCHLKESCFQNLSQQKNHITRPAG